MKVTLRQGVCSEGSLQTIPWACGAAQCSCPALGRIFKLYKVEEGTFSSSLVRQEPKLLLLFHPSRDSVAICQPLSNTRVGEQVLGSILGQPVPHEVIQINKCPGEKNTSQHTLQVLSNPPSAQYIRKVNQPHAGLQNTPGTADFP